MRLHNCLRLLDAPRQSPFKGKVLLHELALLAFHAAAGVALGAALHGAWARARSGGRAPLAAALAVGIGVGVACVWLGASLDDGWVAAARPRAAEAGAGAPTAWSTAFTLANIVIITACCYL